MNNNKELPLAGVKIIDFTHVQAGPACTQMLAWFGADVVKIERPGSGDITRNQLRDIPDADALYFTMLNSNKRSLTLDTKKPEGKEVLTRLIKESDVMVENFGPGALDRMGFTWEHIQELNPRMILASVKGFSEGHHYEHLRAYENVAQCAGGAASTTGWWKGENAVPTISAAALGDSNTGMHLAIGILTAYIGRQKTGKGQKVACAMQDAVLNLCRVKMRDQLRLDNVGYLEEYPQYPHEPFSDVVPRGGNAGGGGQPGWILKCKGWESDPNAYIYFTVQDLVWTPICDAIERPEWREDPAYTTPKARQPHIMDIFGAIESFILRTGKNKFDAVEYFGKFSIPCAPVMSMKELLHDESLRKSGSIVEVPHKVRGSYWTVGCPIKFSTLKPEITASPLLGEHTDDVLAELGYSTEQIALIHTAKAV
ncbi:Formyl-CoA:oxalate CoA-transferase [Dickeya dianthicola]|uniref:Formyl-CoA:oxalate CoA-transferase n=1 Tax=Dickeya dianthicola TaxID=204039 RepID=A0AAP2CX83_9GAMM|nr:formyl-CoA transferase [Dickeya dianthicola]ATO35500.1 Formyl-coenzyme A transferase [Dickeya dianthicola RNS04.9]AYC16949.1 Formyl-CoA:oxalate CoA-transferase [Dickeya dianthicola]MBI0436834.1 formyl-CoA transferase [Dickeya dianthicola]MBI0448006.1 formyl-CoA transferase [Dickeya dianthicola]MBI0452146.1 formyl-CoA transferase [Dickeya dianthicola]